MLVSGLIVIALQASATASVPETPPATPAQLASASLHSSDYPRAAIKKGEQGSVTVSYSVTEKGKPANCTVVQSSGSAALDTQSCTLMTKRFRYHPARDAHHHRVAQHMNQVFDWSLGKCPPLGPTDICITPN